MTATARIDAAACLTSDFRPGPQHEQLLALVGRWSGTTSTWLAPQAPADEAGTEATIEALLGGRFVRIDYQSAVQGKPHAGQMLFGFHSDARAFELAWLDSFHTGTAIMLSTGAADDGAHGALVSVLGSYRAGPERWGWRTVLRPLHRDELVIEAYNVSPSGHEDRAIATRLKRL